jgi:hypothetical protein
MYANSGSIRDALKAWGGKREDVYVLTKCILKLRWMRRTDSQGVWREVSMIRGRYLRNCFSR